MEYPLVTLIIVVRDNIANIGKSLDSFLKQTYPKEKTEIIVVDSMSTDGTREWLQKKVSNLKEKGMDVRMLDNPKLILSGGWNTAIRNAKGDIVCRIDAHSELRSDYVEKGVKELIEGKNENVICVGGVLQNIGNGHVGNAVADLFSSRFGVGNSAFRTGIKKTTYTDTAVFALYWKRVFDEVGYFNEDIARNQDIELHARIKKNGYRFLTLPDMEAIYYVRDNVPNLIKKGFSDGYWTVRSRQSLLRHKIPLLFVLYLACIPFVIWFSGFHSAPTFALLTILFLYFLLLIFFSIKDGKYHGKILLFALFPIFHISYGAGSLKALFETLCLEKLARRLNRRAT